MDLAGQLLFQHQNTIRYRISKIKSILDIESDFEFQMLAFFLVHIVKE